MLMFAVVVIALCMCSCSSVVVAVLNFDAPLTELMSQELSYVYLVLL